MPRRVEVPSYPVSIFLAGNVKLAERICQKYCNDVGLCVAVSETNYIFKDGYETGVVVGLINYPRFPKLPEEIFSIAEALTLLLISGMDQKSASIQAPDKTLWISFRPGDQEETL